MRNQQKPSSAIITKVAGKSTFVEPIQRIYKSQSQSSLSTPKKDDEVKSIVKKYLGNDALTESRVNEFKSTQGSITTMFHHLSEEGKSIVVSPYKTLSRNDYNRYFDTFQRMQDSPGEIEDEEFHHLKTSSDYSPSQLNQFKESRVNSKVSINSIEEITNDLKQVFESPQSQELKQKIEQSPEFFNPMTPITQMNQVQSVFLNKDLPVIEENEEIKIDNDQFTKKLNSLLGQIDSKLSFQQNGKQLPNKTIQRIKQKYEPKLSSFKPQDEIFKDFPSEDDIPLSTSQNQTKSIIVNSLKFSERSQTVPEFIEPKGWSFDEDEDHSTQRNEKNQKQNQNQKLKYSIQEYLNPQYNVLTQKSQQNSPAAFEHQQQQQQQQQQQKQQKTGMISVIRTKKMIKSIVILLILILIGEVYYVMNSYFQ